MKKDVWDIIFWTAMLILIGYIIAKLTGIINTPEWVNLIPFITITFMIGAFYQKIINFSETMYKRTDYLKSSIDKTSEKLIEQDRRIYLLENFKK